LALDRDLSERVDLLVQPLVLALRVDEAAEVAVDVSKRPRDPLCGDLERAKDGDAGGLDPAQSACGGVAERDGDQDEGQEDEGRDNGPALEGGAGARRKRLRPAAA
jgi:hypothetical protein